MANKDTPLNSNNLVHPKVRRQGVGDRRLPVSINTVGKGASLSSTRRASRVPRQPFKLDSLIRPVFSHYAFKLPGARVLLCGRTDHCISTTKRIVVVCRSIDAACPFQEWTGVDRAYKRT